MADDKSATPVTSGHPHGIVQDDIETWRAHLTPELRAHFDRKGYSIVEIEVLGNNYRAPGDDRKHFAAAAWLHEMRAEDKIDENTTRTLVLVSVVVAIIAIIALIVSLVSLGL